MRPSLSVEWPPPALRSTASPAGRPAAGPGQGAGADIVSSKEIWRAADIGPRPGRVNPGLQGVPAGVALVSGDGGAYAGGPGIVLHGRPVRFGAGGAARS